MLSCIFGIISSRGSIESNFLGILRVGKFSTDISIYINIFYNIGADYHARDVGLHAIAHSGLNRVGTTMDHAC